MLEILGEEGAWRAPETEIPRGGERVGDAKRSTFRVVSIEIFWNNTLHVRSLMTVSLCRLGPASWRADASNNAPCRNGFFSCPNVTDKRNLD